MPAALESPTPWCSHLPARPLPGRAHKLAIEPGSPSCFFSCGEDGEVRHFDLREPAAGHRRLLVCRATAVSRSAGRGRGGRARQASRPPTAVWPPAWAAPCKACMEPSPAGGAFSLGHGHPPGACWLAGCPAALCLHKNQSCCLRETLPRSPTAAIMGLRAGRWSSTASTATRASRPSLWSVARTSSAGALGGAGLGQGRRRESCALPWPRLQTTPCLGCTGSAALRQLPAAGPASGKGSPLSTSPPCCLRQGLRPAQAQPQLRLPAHCGRAGERGEQGGGSLPPS